MGRLPPTVDRWGRRPLAEHQPSDDGNADQDHDGGTQCAQTVDGVPPRLIDLVHGYHTLTADMDRGAQHLGLGGQHRPRLRHGTRSSRPCAGFAGTGPAGQYSSLGGR